MLSVVLMGQVVFVSELIIELLHFKKVGVLVGADTHPGDLVRFVVVHSIHIVN